MFEDLENAIKGSKATKRTLNPEELANEFIYEGINRMCKMDRKDPSDVAVNNQVLALHLKVNFEGRCKKLFLQLAHDLNSARQCNHIENEAKAMAAFSGMAWFVRMLMNNIAYSAYIQLLAATDAKDKKLTTVPYKGEHTGLKLASYTPHDVCEAVDHAFQDLACLYRNVIQGADSGTVGLIPTLSIGSMRQPDGTYKDYVLFSDYVEDSNKARRKSKANAVRDALAAMENNDDDE